MPGRYSDGNNLYLKIREETLSRWRQIDGFKEAVEDGIEDVLSEIDETHKNLLISSQAVINEALNNKELDLFKKANLALRYMSLIKGKDDITQKSFHNLFKYAELGRLQNITKTIIHNFYAVQHA